MHYAEFAEDEVSLFIILIIHTSFPFLLEVALQYIHVAASLTCSGSLTQSQALLSAIREYEANRWKVIGAKVGKPAKVCQNVLSPSCIC